MNIRQLKKLQTFWDFTQSIAELSTCKRRRVGALIMPKDFTCVHAIGYNGPPHGEANDSCTGESGACGCIHAEANTLLKLKTNESGLIMLLTLSPCPHCAGLIINSRRIAQVIYGERWRNDPGVERLRRAGVNAVLLEEVIQCRYPIG